MVDVTAAIKSAIATGEVCLGTDVTKKRVREGKVKMVIVARNAPEKEFGDVPVYEFPGTNADLGVACGKPFPVAVVGIIDEGQSEILALVKKS